MKREIFCNACAQKLAPIKPLQQVTALDSAMAAQEQVVKVYGKSRGNYCCDFCGEPITPGDTILAETIVPIGQSYAPWEDDYVEPASAH